MPDVLPVRTTRRDAQRTYDHLSRIYNLTEGVFERAAVRQALNIADARPGETVLEVAPGTGQALAQLARATGASGVVCAVDLSPGMLAQARRQREVRRAALMLGDAARLPLASGRFDLVFMSFALELMPTAEIPAVLTEILRVLKPGGRFVDLSLSRESPNIMTWLYERGHTLMPRIVDCRPIYARRDLDAAGFEIAAAHRVAVWGLPAEIVRAYKPATQERNA